MEQLIQPDSCVSIDSKVMGTQAMKVLMEICNASFVKATCRFVSV